MSRRFFEKRLFDIHNLEMATDRHQAPSYPLRMPDDLKARVQEAAAKSGRSLHGELLHRLDEGANPGEMDRLRQRIARLEGELAGTKAATDMLVDRASRRIGKLALANGYQRALIGRLSNTFEDLAELAQQYIDGEVRDPKLGEAQFAALIAEKSAINDALDQIQLEEEEAVVEGKDSSPELGAISRKKVSITARGKAREIEVGTDATATTDVATEEAEEKTAAGRTKRSDMASVNKVIIVGNLGGEPDVREPATPLKPVMHGPQPSPNARKRVPNKT